MVSCLGRQEQAWVGVSRPHFSRLWGLMINFWGKNFQQFINNHQMADSLFQVVLQTERANSLRQTLDLPHSSMQSLASPLFRIPAELRFRIYHFAVESYGDFTFEDSSRLGYGADKAKNPRAVVEFRSSTSLINLVLVCKQIACELQPNFHLPCDTIRSCLSGVTLLPGAQTLNICASSRFVVDTSEDYLLQLLDHLTPFRSAIRHLIFHQNSTDLFMTGSLRRWFSHDGESNEGKLCWTISQLPNLEEVGLVLPDSRVGKRLMAPMARKFCNGLDAGGLPRILFLCEDVLPEPPKDFYTNEVDPRTETPDRFIITKELFVLGRSSTSGISWPEPRVHESGQCVYILEKNPNMVPKDGSSSLPVADDID